MKLINILDFNKFIKIYETETSAKFSDDPLGVAVLGSPAGGKSWTVNKIKDVAGDSRINRTLDQGTVLTVDKLRDEFQSKDPMDQIKGFIHAFYLMKKKSIANPNEFGKWFNDIKNLWTTKIAPMAPQLKVQITNNQLLFNGQQSLKSFNSLKNMDAKKIVDSLDKYNDYKRVVRYFQSLKQENAIKKLIDVSYDEAGDEPEKIIDNMKKLNQKGYVTDVFLLHPSNIASNIIQNYYRVTTGGDGGRDSSGAIIQAYNDIEKNKEIYSKNAQEVVNVKSTELDKLKDTLKQANVPDDASRGNKPIDVLAKVQPREPQQAFQDSLKVLNTDQQNVFKALLKYAIYGTKGLPQNAKDALLNLTKDIDNNKALQILQQASDSKKYVFSNGGITPELVQKAKQVMQVAAPATPAAPAPAAPAPAAPAPAAPAPAAPVKKPIQL